MMQVWTMSTRQSILGQIDPDRQPHEHYRTRPLTLLAKGLKKGDVEENDIINNNTDGQRDKPILHE